MESSLWPFYLYIFRSLFLNGLHGLRPSRPFQRDPRTLWWCSGQWCMVWWISQPVSNWLPLQSNFWIFIFYLGHVVASFIRLGSFNIGDLPSGIILEILEAIGLILLFPGIVFSPFCKETSEFIPVAQEIIAKPTDRANWTFATFIFLRPKAETKHLFPVTDLDVYFFQFFFLAGIKTSNNKTADIYEYNRRIKATLFWWKLEGRAFQVSFTVWLIN